MEKKLFNKRIKLSTDVVKYMIKQKNNKKSFYYVPRYPIDDLIDLSEYNSLAYDINFEELDRIWKKSKFNVNGTETQLLFDSKEEEMYYKRLQDVEKFLFLENSIIIKAINIEPHTTCECEFTGTRETQMAACDKEVRESRCPYINSVKC